MSTWTAEEAHKRWKRRLAKRKRLKELLGGKCAKCGSKQNLEFDHLSPEDKEFKISKYIDLSDDNLVLEVKKCQLLCKKCHHQKTLDKQEYNPVAPHGTILRYKRDKCRCNKCKQAMIDFNSNIS